MARKQAPKFRSPHEDTKWRIPKKGENGEWFPIVRVGRQVPFGYEQDENDRDILQPIPYELDLLETAKTYLKEYSFRMVAQWLSKESGRYISHNGLYKRVNIEQKRRNAAKTYRIYEKLAEEAAQKARRLEENRLGGVSTRTRDED